MSVVRFIKTSFEATLFDAPCLHQALSFNSNLGIWHAKSIHGFFFFVSMKNTKKNCYFA